MRSLQIEIDRARIAEQVRQGLARIESERNGKNIPRVLIVTLECPPMLPDRKIDLLSWLRAQTEIPKIYWESRKGDEEFAGFGAAITISETDASRLARKYQLIEDIIQLGTEEWPLRFFGGASFNCDVQYDADWADFPAMWYVLPAVLCRRSEKSFRVSVAMLVRPGQTPGQLVGLFVTKFQEIETAFYSTPRKKLGTEFYPIPALLRRVDQPEYKGWQRQILHSLQLIARQKLQKVVLARKTTLEFDDKLDWHAILTSLKERNENCFSFFFQPRRNNVFLGSTPERLFKIDGSVLISEAVSGTIARKQNEEEDRRSGLELLQSNKNLREHRFVIEALREIFEKLCNDVAVQQEPSLLKLKNVQHLYSKIMGNLRARSIFFEKERPSIHDIIMAIHPTPAVGGTPKNEAMSLIHELEPFDRRWYAGPVGMISNVSEMVVALRSMLVTGKRVHLFAGAGIVDGSEPESEWQEIESKISIAMKLFRGE